MPSHMYVCKYAILDSLKHAVSDGLLVERQTGATCRTKFHVQNYLDYCLLTQ